MTDFNTGVYDAVRRSSVIHGSAVELSHAVQLMKEQNPGADEQQVLSAVRSLDKKMVVVTDDDGRQAIAIKAFVEIDPMYRRIKASAAKLIQETSESIDVPIESLVQNMDNKEKPRRIKF